MPRKHRCEFAAYKITCAVNGRVYIGITSYPLADRWRSHVYQAKKGRTSPLQSAIRQYGSDAFSIEHVASAYSWNDLLLLEESLIRQWDSMVSGNGYNATVCGTSRGRRQSDDERAMRSLAAHEKMKDPAVLAGYRERLTRLNKIKRPPKETCKRGHSLADAYRNGKGRVCRVCTDSNRRLTRQRARESGQTGYCHPPIGNVVHEGVSYPSVYAVAKAHDHTYRWAIVRFRRGDIVRALPSGAEMSVRVD